MSIPEIKSRHFCQKLFSDNVNVNQKEGFGILPLPLSEGDFFVPALRSSPRPVTRHASRVIRHPSLVPHPSPGALALGLRLFRSRLWTLDFGLWTSSVLFLLFLTASVARGSEPIHAGPLFDDCKLTLSLGERTEALGPLFYDEESEGKRTWAIPPLLSDTHDPATALREFDLLYPILTYDRYGDQYRWQLCQTLIFAGGPSQTESNRNRFTLFPVYFQQRSSDPEENYTAVFPFYGHLKHRLFRDEISFVMFPCYGESRKKDVVTDNYLYPFVHLRHGDGLHGWQVWPLVGHEHKEVTTVTNLFGDSQTVGGHDDLFVLWPFFLKDRTGIGTDNPEWLQASLPLYSVLRSPKRDSTTILWPFFSHVTDREKQYREWELPWPFVVFARGEGKTVNRVWPFFSQAHTPTLESDFYLWPVYKYNRANLDALDRRRTRIVFYLYSDATDKNKQTGAYRRHSYLWPLFTSHREFDGSTRLQVFAPLEPFAEGSHKIERDWSPLWSVWRSQKNGKTGATSQSLLWNLYRRESAPQQKRVSALFGLLQYQQTSDGKRVKLFYIPL
jgi:hypothetical protein